jgi:hypothetical protein
MDLIKEHEGVEEWFCPDCGRHMLVNWSPKFKRVIIEIGDQSVGHNGFKSDVQPEDMMVTSADEIHPQKEMEKPINESRLTPWAIWMDKTDFADLWNGSV